jgi:mRNA interferase RelE/StbE
MPTQGFQIQYAKLAIENLRELPKPVAAQIMRKISRLEGRLVGNIKKLRAADFGYRFRMGHYRILFDLEGDTIVIHKIAHRKEVYE